MGPLAALALLAPSAAVADDPTPEPDTTPPSVQLDPCPEVPVGEPCGQHQFAWVAGFVAEGDDLAALGVSLDGQLVRERVYDDGSGFEPYGFFLSPFNDAAHEVDYASVVEVPPGVHEVAFHARDLAGNERSVERTVVGADVPSRVGLPRVEHRRHSVVLRWGYPRSVGSYVYRFRVRVRGEGLHLITSYIPSSPVPALVLRGLDRGRHVARVSAVNGVGRGPARSVVFRVR